MGLAVSIYSGMGIYWAQRERYQFYDNPVHVPRLPTSFGLPSIAHILTPPGEKQVVFSAEMLIAAGNRQSPRGDVSKVDNCFRVRREDRDRISIEAETRDSCLFRNPSQVHTALRVMSGTDEPPSGNMLKRTWE